MFRQTIRFFDHPRTMLSAMAAAALLSGSATAEWCHTGCGDNHDFGTFTPDTQWSTHSTSFEANGCRWYRFNLAVASEYTFSTCQGGGTASGNSRLTLYDSLCQQLAQNDDSLECSPTWRSHLVFAPPASGYYYLRVDEPSDAGLSWTLAWRGEVVLDPPAPEILEVAFPARVEIDDWAEIDVTVRNAGGPAFQGGISVSIPSFDQPGDADRAEDAGSDAGIPGYSEHPANSSIWHRDGYPFPADYLLVEWQDTDWMGDAVRILRLRVRPKTLGTFVFQVRSAMTGDGTEWTSTPTSGPTDQQGWSVIPHEIDVVLPCPADLDGNGEVGFLDLLTMLSSWGPCADCPGDIDGDGEVGFNDLLLLLVAWGECP